MDTGTGLTIQQVARQTGLSIDTLRYYERIGLLAPIARAPSGHRRYTQHDISWIELLIRLRETGMPLAQMIRFAQLRRQGASTVAERRTMLEEHQRSLDQQMQRLEQHMAALQQKIARLRAREAEQAAASHPAHAAHTVEPDEAASTAGPSGKWLSWHSCVRRHPLRPRRIGYPRGQGDIGAQTAAASELQSSSSFTTSSQAAGK